MKRPSASLRGLAASLFLLSAWPATGADSVPLDAEGRLALGAATRQMLERNFALRAQEQDVATARDEVTRAWAGFDPKLYASTMFEDNLRKLNAIDYSSFGLNSADPRTALYAEKNHRSAAGVAGKVPFTGAEYDLSITLDRLENDVNRAGRYFFPEYQSFSGLTLTQPLLKGLWYGAPMAEVRAGKLGVLIAERTREVEVVNKMIELVNAYYDLLFGQENIVVKTEAVSLADKVRTDNTERSRVGQMTSLDVTQAEVKVSEAREELLLARDFARERRVRVLKLLLRDFTPGAIPEFTVVGDLAVAPAPSDPGPLVDVALTRRPDYLLVREQAQLRGVAAGRARSDRLPQLNVRLSYGRGGLNDTAGNSLSEIGSENRDRWSAGLVASLPLGNREAASIHRIAQRRVQQSEAHAAELRLTIGLEVSNALARLAVLQQRLETAAQSRALASAGYAAERTRLDAGKSSSFAVLDLQQKMSEARTRELAARIDLKKAEAELWASTGDLPTRLGFAFTPVAGAKR